MYLTNIYRTFYSKTSGYIFFSAAQGTFSKINHILGHKVSLNKCKKTEVTSYVLSDHNGIKLEINNKRNYLWLYILKHGG
jgi:hypothetical protein